MRRWRWRWRFVQPPAPGGRVERGEEYYGLRLEWHFYLHFDPHAARTCEFTRIRKKCALIWSTYDLPLRVKRACVRA